MAEADWTLGMVAGEASGDLLAAAMLQALQQRWPGLRAQGVGGPHMAQAGFEAWWPSSRLAVRGYVEVLRHYPGLLALRRQLRQRLLAQPTRAFIGVDAPDFNLGLEEKLRAAGVKTIHFVCPSIWAWRPERVHVLKRAADHVLCIFPFEPALLHAHGVAATYVGHPLADAIPMAPPRAQARAALGLPPDAEVVALLPGSRRSEIEYLAPVFLQAAALMRQQRPGLRFILPAAPGLHAQLRAELARWLPEGVDLLEGQSHAALAACDVTLIASGTATLEAALFKRPMVIAYAVHPLTYRIMKPKQLQPWVGLPNILCREAVVPECLQTECNAPRLAQETLAWLDDAPRAAALQARFATLHDQLRQDTAQKATDAIAQILQA